MLNIFPPPSRLNKQPLECIREKRKVQNVTLKTLIKIGLSSFYLKCWWHWRATLYVGGVHIDILGASTLKQKFSAKKKWKPFWEGPLLFPYFSLTLFYMGFFYGSFYMRGGGSWAYPAISRTNSQWWYYVYI